MYSQQIIVVTSSEHGIAFLSIWVVILHSIQQLRACEPLCVYMFVKACMNAWICVLICVSYDSFNLQSLFFPVVFMSLCLCRVIITGQTHVNVHR